jgi:hypothetical protein
MQRQCSGQQQCERRLPAHRKGNSAHKSQQVAPQLGNTQWFDTARHPLILPRVSWPIPNRICPVSSAATASLPPLAQRPPPPPSSASKARGTDLRVHFKNTFEVAAAIRGMQIDAAERFVAQRHVVVSIMRTPRARVFTCKPSMNADAVCLCICARLHQLCQRTRQVLERRHRPQGHCALHPLQRRCWPQGSGRQARVHQGSLASEVRCTYPHERTRALHA